MNLFDILTKNRLQTKFEKFHATNPHIYESLVTLARRAKRRGLKKVGIGMLYEVLRWNSMVRTDAEDYKLSNSFRSRYARLIMEREPELKDIFELRELRSKK